MQLLRESTNSDPPNTMPLSASYSLHTWQECFAGTCHVLVLVQNKQSCKSYAKAASQNAVPPTWFEHVTLCSSDTRCFRLSYESCLLHRLAAPADTPTRRCKTPSKSNRVACAATSATNAETILSVACAVVQRIECKRARRDLTRFACIKINQTPQKSLRKLPVRLELTTACLLSKRSTTEL